MTTVTLTGCERVNRMLARQDHSVPPQVSWTTYQGIIGLVHRYGND